MDASYRVSIDDPGPASARRLVKRGRWPWPFPPRVGDHVVIDRRLAVAAEIKAIVFTPEEERMLMDFQADGLRGDIQEQVDAMLALGFVEVDPGDEPFAEP